MTIDEKKIFSHSYLIIHDIDMPILKKKLYIYENIMFVSLKIIILKITLRSRYTPSFIVIPFNTTQF